MNNDYLFFNQWCEKHDAVEDFWDEVEKLTKLDNLVRSLRTLRLYGFSDLSGLRKWGELNKTLSVQQNGRVRLVTTLYIRPKCPSDLSIFGVF